MLKLKRAEICVGEIEMGSNGQRRHLLSYLLFLWTFCTIKAYEDSICDEPNPGIFCTCDTKYRDTNVVCYITHQVNSHDEIWQSLGKVENLVNLKLNSMSQELKLDYIPTDSLQVMDSLRTFTVQQANLGVLKSNAVSDLKELRELQLEGNDITQLEAESISNLPKLKKLSLSENLLQELLVDSIKGVEELEQLFLDRNNISRIEGCAFCDLHSLRDLELFGNSITDLTEYMFTGLRYLKRLDLYKNRIRILNDKVFHSMPKLVEIDLTDNLISHVASRAFYGLPKLQKLMLNSNKIKMLPDVVFKSLPTLRNIDLYNNELETLQVEVVENLANVKDEHFSLAFKENPIRCDCRLQWVKTYLQLNKSHQFTRELHDLRCRPDGENQTLQTVHLLEADCRTTGSTRTTKDHVPAAIATSRSVEKSSSLVPQGIQSRRNKTRLTTVADMMPEVQDAEAAEDSESYDSGSSSNSLVGDAKLVLVTLVGVFVVRKRKGTLL